MTKNTRKFHDGAAYSLKSALSTWDKGGNRVLSAIFYECMDIQEHRNSTNLRTMAHTLSTSDKAFSTLRGIVKAVSDGHIRIVRDKKSKEIKVNLSKPDEFALNNEHMAILATYANKGLSFMNNGLAAALGMTGAAPADFDAEKRIKSLVKKCSEEGISKAEFIRLANAAWADHEVTEGEAPTKGAKSRPVMDSTMARAAA